MAMPHVGFWGTLPGGEKKKKLLLLKYDEQVRSRGCTRGAGLCLAAAAAALSLACGRLRELGRCRFFAQERRATFSINTAWSALKLSDGVNQQVRVGENYFSSKQSKHSVGQPFSFKDVKVSDGRDRQCKLPDFLRALSDYRFSADTPPRLYKVVEVDGEVSGWVAGC